MSLRGTSIPAEPQGDREAPTSAIAFAPTFEPGTSTDWRRWSRTRRSGASSTRIDAISMTRRTLPNCPSPCTRSLRNIGPTLSSIATLTMLSTPKLSRSASQAVHDIHPTGARPWPSTAMSLISVRFDLSHIYFFYQKHLYLGSKYFLMILWRCFMRKTTFVKTATPPT